MQIAEAVNKAGEEADEHMQALLQLKAKEVMSKLDLSKALSLETPPEQIVAEAMQQATAQLQAEGVETLLSQPGTSAQQPASDPSQVHSQRHLIHNAVL